MIQAKQVREAGQFLALHTDPGLFILPDAWDVVSAKVYETAGFQAIGTTSAGIAATPGKESLIAPDRPAEGATVAFIVDDGAQLSSSSSIRKGRKDARFGHESPV